MKDDRGRKLLSDIKQAFVDYDDLPRRWLVDSYREFLTTDERIMFIHCREPEEIQHAFSVMEGRNFRPVFEHLAPLFTQM